MTDSAVNGHFRYRIVIDSVMILAALGAGIWINSSITVLQTEIAQLNKDQVAEGRIVRMEDRIGMIESNLKDLKDSNQRIEAWIVVRQPRRPEP